MDRREFFASLALASQWGTGETTLKASGRQSPLLYGGQAPPGIEITLRFGTLTVLVKPIPQERKKIGEPEDFEFSTGIQWDQLRGVQFQTRGTIRVAYAVMPEAIWDQIYRQYSDISCMERNPLTIEITGAAFLTGGLPKADPFKVVFDQVILEGMSQESDGVSGLTTVKHLRLSGRYVGQPTTM